MTNDRSEKLYKGIIDIDDKYIEEAQTAKLNRKRTVWIRYAAAAACLCLIAVSTIPIFRGDRQPITGDTNNDLNPVQGTAQGQDLSEISSLSYRVILTDESSTGDNKTNLYFVSAQDGLNIPISREEPNEFAAHVAPDEIQDAEANGTMTFDEAENYAYLDYDSASPELQEKILEARSIIVFNSAWVADGYSGCIQDVETGKIIKTLPLFSELFPDWEMPSMETPADSITEDGLGANLLYGISLQVIQINQDEILCISTEQMNMFKENQKITVFPPASVSLQELKLKVGDFIFASYYGKSCSLSSASVCADSIVLK